MTPEREEVVDITKEDGSLDWQKIYKQLFFKPPAPDDPDLDIDIMELLACHRGKVLKEIIYTLKEQEPTKGQNMTEQEIENKKAIIAATNKAFGTEARAAGISTGTIGRVIAFLITTGRDVWPYVRSILDDLINPPDCNEVTEPEPEAPHPIEGSPVDPPAEPGLVEPPTPEELPPTEPPESPK